MGVQTTDFLFIVGDYAPPCRLGSTTGCIETQGRNDSHGGQRAECA